MPTEENNTSQGSLTTRIGVLDLNDSALATEATDPPQPLEAAGAKAPPAAAGATSMGSYETLKSLTRDQLMVLLQGWQPSTEGPAQPRTNAPAPLLCLSASDGYTAWCYRDWYRLCIQHQKLLSPAQWSPLQSTGELDQAQAYLDAVTASLDGQVTEPQRLQFTIKFWAQIGKVQTEVDPASYCCDLEQENLYRKIQRQLSNKLEEARRRYGETQREQQKRLPTLNNVPLLDIMSDSDFNSLKEKIKEEFQRSQFHIYHQFSFLDIAIAKAVKETPTDKLHYRVTACVTALTKLKDKQTSQELQGLTFEDIFEMPAFKTDTIINYALREAMTIRRTGKMTADEHLPTFGALWTRALERWRKQCKEHELNPEELLDLINVDMTVAKALATYHKSYEGELDAMVRARKLNGHKYWTDGPEIEKCLQELTADNDKSCRKEPKANTTAATEANKRPTAASDANKRKRPTTDGGPSSQSAKRPRVEGKQTNKKWTCTRPCITCKKDATQNFHRDVRKDGKDVPCPASPTHPRYVEAAEKVRKSRPDIFKTHQ